MTRSPAALFLIVLAIISFVLAFLGDPIGGHQLGWLGLAFLAGSHLF